MSRPESANLRGQPKEKLLSRPSEGRPTDIRPSHQVNNPELISRPSLHELATFEFYKKENWFDLFCESLFKIKTRNTTIKAECYYGLIHFISCMYCLAVIPQQLNAAGYGSRSTVVSVAACAGVGSIVCGLFSNLPFVIAPPTVVSIFLSVFLQQKGDTRDLGDLAVIISGVVLVFFGWRPLFRIAAELIPIPIQVGTAVGIGLMTALAGSTEISLVVKGKYTILDIGKITPEICIAISGVAIVCISMVFKVKGAFCIAVIFCSLVWWIYDNDWPSAVFSAPFADKANGHQIHNSRLPLLTVDLIFLYVLYLNGLVTSLSNLAHLTKQDGNAPRARWIFICSGAFTIIAGLLSGPPMLISPESAASIKAGAKTGLSTVVCGVLFCLSVFLSPVFEAVPAAGTSPILIMIGVILFQNVSRIDWRSIIEAAPAFVVLFYIPFTYSVIQGVVLGYIVYMIIALFSGDLRENSINLAVLYVPSQKSWLDTLRDPNFHRDEDEEEQQHYHEHGPDVEGHRDSDATDRSASKALDDSMAQRSVSSDRRGINLSMTLDLDTPPVHGGESGKKQRSSVGMFDTSNAGANAMTSRQSQVTVGRTTSTGSQSQTHRDVESALHHQQQHPRQSATVSATAAPGSPSPEESKETRVPFRSSSEHRVSSTSGGSTSSTSRSSFGGGAPTAAPPPSEP